MASVCGIIDPSHFMEGGIDFAAMRRMWCSFAPLGRGYTYIKSGISLCCDLAAGLHASLPCPTNAKKNCSAMICAPTPSPFMALDLLESYILGGATSLCKVKDDFSFILLDENERLLILSCADVPFFCTRVGEKIIFSSESIAIDAYFGGSADFPIKPVMLPQKGFALFCDIRGAQNGIISKE